MRHHERRGKSPGMAMWRRPDGSTFPVIGHDASGQLIGHKATARPPWQVRAENRRKAKRARMARRRNR